MDKLKMHTPDLAAANIERLAELFPACVTESRGDDGAVKRAIDFDLLRQELSDHIVEGPQERYRLDWPGKREALLAANAPIAKTLRPCREESVDFNTTQNLFIEGDNLDALKLLQETYLGKVKVIYIDPPYNTGNDFIYEDNFAESCKEYLFRSNQKSSDGNLISNSESSGRFHSDWASMIYSRLRLARNLMTRDGIILISVDDVELGNLVSIGSEVFGGENFLAVFIWQKRTSRENRKVFSINHDYVVAFSREKSEFQEQSGSLPYTEDVLGRYKNPDDDPRGPWQSVALSVQGGHGTRSQFYDIETPSGRMVSPPSGLCWRYTQDKLAELVKDGRIWFGDEGNNVPRLKLFLSEMEQGLTPHTLWLANEVGTTDSAKREVNSLFDGVSVFDTPKPIGLIQRFLQIASKSKDYLVLDFFSGSSSTAHAVMAQNIEDGGSRSCISVQIPEPVDTASEAGKAGYRTISDIGKDRIRRASKLIQKQGLDKIDTGFRVLKIDASNMTEVHYTPDALQQNDLLGTIDNVRPDRTAEDLLFQVLLDWGVDLALPINREQIAGRDVFFVDSNALAACFVADGSVDEEFVKELAKRQPLRAVFRDAGFANDNARINVEQIFKTLSPITDVKTL